jgi:hypothetical protein
MKLLEFFYDRLCEYCLGGFILCFFILLGGVFNFVAEQIRTNMITISGVNWLLILTLIISCWAAGFYLLRVHNTDYFR